MKNTKIASLFCLLLSSSSLWAKLTIKAPENGRLNTIHKIEIAFTLQHNPKYNQELWNKTGLQFMHFALLLATGEKKNNKIWIEFIGSPWNVLFNRFGQETGIHGNLHFNISDHLDKLEAMAVFYHDENYNTLAWKDLVTNTQKIFSLPYKQKEFCASLSSSLFEEAIKNAHEEGIDGELTLIYS